MTRARKPTQAERDAAKVERAAAAIEGARSVAAALDPNRHTPEHAPGDEVVGDVRVLERLTFVAKAAPKPEDREHVYMEPGLVLEALAPNDNEKRDAQARTAAGRPGFVVVRWLGIRRSIPRAAVEWIR